MRGLVDRLHDQLNKVDYIVSSASGCGVTLKEYPIYLSDDHEYADKSRRINEKVVDVAELLGKFDFSGAPIRASVHTPCSLQHGQSIDGEIERVLEKSGVTVTKSARSQPCCGSAGSYSIMQPGLAGRLRDRRLNTLEASSPDVIVTANIGCQLHLQSGTDIPVMHWVELLWRQLIKAPD
jgi:glycolate oxidase iron-sulfur subunit